MEKNFFWYCGIMPIATTDTQNPDTISCPWSPNSEKPAQPIQGGMRVHPSECNNCTYSKPNFPITSEPRFNVDK